MQGMYNFLDITLLIIPTNTVMGGDGSKGFQITLSCTHTVFENCVPIRLMILLH